MDTNEILDVLNQNYCLDIKSIELYREGGNLSFIVYDARNIYFLKILRPPFVENALLSIDIQLYLLKNAFPVIPIVLSKRGFAYIQTGAADKTRIYVLYEYVEGEEPDPDNTEKAGALIGRLHRVMRSFPGVLPARDKRFFIDKYLEIMQEKRYGNVGAFREYGDALWERVKSLPRGYCHGDLYRGNIHQDNKGTLRVLDFDTSCDAFPMYDIVLFCNDTHWFHFEQDGYEKSKIRLERFLAGYLRYCSLSKEEMDAFYDLIAVYHFQLQATVMEVYGYDCVDTDFFGKQYDWLVQWKEQCEAIGKL